MAYLNLNRNIFLEKEELTRFQQFLSEGISKVLFLKNTTDFGIVLSDFVNATPTDFLVEAGTNSGSVKIAVESYALDADGLLIHQLPIDNIAIPDDNSYYWMKIAHAYSNLEVGTLSIDSAGGLSGTGTKFLEVLRAASSDVPTKIVFYKSSSLLNTGVYELVTVTDDVNAAVTGGVFQAESNINYYVIGTTPINESITSPQLDGLYQYDSCTITLVAEIRVDEAPSGLDTGREFYLARIKNTAGTMSITDKRTDWWSFNITGLADKLSKTSNLSDLSSVATARDNLDVYNKADTRSLVSSPNTHTQVSGTVDLYGVGISSRNLMADMTITYTPKGNNALVLFSAVFHTGDEIQRFVTYVNVNGTDARTDDITIYSGSISFAVQCLTPVSKGVSTTIKMEWKANENIVQYGSASPRVLTIIDLP